MTAGPGFPRAAPRAPSNWASRLAAPALAAALCAAVFLVLAHGHVLAPGDGLVTIPMRVWWWQRWRLGGGWNPWVFGGFPSDADPGQAPYYLPNALYALLDPVPATNAVVILTYALAALGAALYVRALGARGPGVICAGLGYALCGVLPAHLQHITMAGVGLAIPWTCLALDRLRGARLAVAVAALAALMVFGGHPQVTLYGLGVCAAYALYRPTRSAGSYWTPLAAGAVSGLCVAALAVLPVVALAPQSLRAQMTEESFQSFSLAPAKLLLLAFPFSCGGAVPDWFGAHAPYVGSWFLWELTGYPGAVAWATVLLAGGRLWTSRHGRFWIAVALVGVALAVGPATRFGWLMVDVPVLRDFRAHARALLLTDLAFAVLLGLGLTPPAGGWRGARVRLLVAVAAVAGATAAALAYLPGTVVEPVTAAVLRRATLTSAALLLTATGTVWVFLAGGRRAAAALVIAVALMDGFAYTRAFDPRAEPGKFALRPALAALAREPGSRRVLGLHGRTGTGVPLPDDFLGDLELASLAPLARLATVQGYNPLALKRPAAMLGNMDIQGAIQDAGLFAPENVALDLFGVGRVVVAEAALQRVPQPLGRTFPGGRILHALADESRWRRTAAAGDDVVYENLHVLPEAWLVAEVRRLPADDVRTAIRTGRLPDGGPFDPRRTGLVEADVALAAPVAEAGRVTLERTSDDHLVVHARNAGDALLVIGDAWYPGWQAEVDGVSSPVVVVDYALRGVHLPPGARTVELRYRPPTAGSGLALAGLGVLVLAGACVREARRDLRASSASRAA